MINNTHLGFFIIFAAFLHPNIILSGLSALVVTFFLVRLLKIDKTYGVRTTLYCNAILLGLFIGNLYLLDWVSLILIIVVMGLNLIFCFSFDALFASLGIPLLSLPFSVIAIFIALSKRKFTAIGHANFYFYELMPEFFNDLPGHMTLLLKSLGTFFCIPDPGFGLLVLLCVLLYSPIIAAFLVSGFFVGLHFDKFFAFTASEYVHQHYYFNFSLIFAFLGGIFLIPSLYSILWATFATLMTVLISTGLSTLFNFGEIPVMALPFNITAILVLRTLKTIAHRKINHYADRIPEESLEQTRLVNLRHANGEIGLFLPVAGEWTIQQSFNDTWTHKGRWQHALDFVIEKDGSTYANRGLEKEDYYAFNQPVYSPVTGHIVSICSTINDNKIEEVDNQNNWGNYLIIKSIHGFYVKLAHLKKNSVIVGLNSYVQAGDLIASCGNSGYSREPHLHLQVQWTQAPGSYTAPFHLLNYHDLTSGSAHFHSLPKTGDRIAPFVFNHALYRALNFKIDEQMDWKVHELNHSTHEVSFVHKLDPLTGKMFWTDGESKLYYHILGTKFYFYDLVGESLSPLWDLYSAAPVIPLVTGKKILFQDSLYLKVTETKVKRLFILSLQLLTGKMTKTKANYELDPANLTLEGLIQKNGEAQKTTLQIDPLKGITQFSIGTRIYERA